MPNFGEDVRKSFGAGGGGRKGTEEQTRKLTKAEKQLAKAIEASTIALNANAKALGFKLLVIKNINKEDKARAILAKQEIKYQQTILQMRKESNQTIRDEVSQKTKLRKAIKKVADVRQKDEIKSIEKEARALDKSAASLKRNRDRLKILAEEYKRNGISIHKLTKGTGLFKHYKVIQ